LLKDAKKASPLKSASSPRKRHQWIVAVTLVQFVVLHQEYLSAHKCWPLFSAKNARWKEATNYTAH